MKTIASNRLLALSLFVLPLLFALPAVAQGGSCRDTWINSAYNQLYHRAPQGSGNGGECNIALYGNGHWSSYADLEAKIQAVKGRAAQARAAQGCRDAWITSAYQQMYHRAPQGSGDSGECSPSLYGGGHWTSFADLEAKIRAAKGGGAAAVHSPGAGLVVVDAQNALRDQNGNVVATPGSYVISLDSPHGSSILQPRPGQVISLATGSLVASGAGNIVASGAGNIVASGAGNIVASGAGNMTGNHYGLQSVGGRRVIHATSVH